MAKTADEKANWEIEAERYKTNWNESQAEIERLRSQVVDAKKKADDAVNDKNELADELRNLKPEYEKTKDELADLQTKLQQGIDVYTNLVQDVETCLGITVQDVETPPPQPQEDNQIAAGRKISISISIGLTGISGDIGAENWDTRGFLYFF